MSTDSKKLANILLTDDNLPEATGLGILKTLQKRNAGKIMSIILLTGNTSQKVQAEAARRGTLGHVVKDAENHTPEHIERLIKKVIAWAGNLNKKPIKFA